MERPTNSSPTQSPQLTQPSPRAADTHIHTHTSICTDTHTHTHSSICTDTHTLLTTLTHTRTPTELSESWAQSVLMWNSPDRLRPRYLRPGDFADHLTMNNSWPHRTLLFSVTLKHVFIHVENVY